MTRPKRTKTQAAVERLIKAQAIKGALHQDEIPPGVDVFASMEAGWEELHRTIMATGLSRRQIQDAKFLYYEGVRTAANLMIYCSGQSRFEAAAEQITRDCIAYETEAEAVLAEAGQRHRQFEDDPADEKTNTPEATSH